MYIRYIIFLSHHNRKIIFFFLFFSKNIILLIYKGAIERNFGNTNIDVLF